MPVHATASTAMGDKQHDDDLIHPDEDATRVLGQDADNNDIEDAPGELKLPGYRDLKKLGRGGMGQAFLAHQYDPVDRQVAVKLIRKKIRSVTSEVRFLVERQALAQMSHPAIAQIFEAGTNPDGYPYFVMEYVPGQTLMSFCNQHRLSLHERLELFVRICQGVSHAHQKGLIHGDLKPGNILVTLIDGTPQPKIIDFGIAATESPASERRHQSAAGTPLYMSPELFDKDAGIDIRLDIYSLGIILYELLSDARPCPGRLFDESDTRLLHQRLTRQAPPAPSRLLEKGSARLKQAAARRNTTPSRLLRGIRGDLDAITLKAIAHERDHRYASVTELAEDIRLHLACQPVHARDAGRLYLAQRFVRRNALVVIAACLITASLAAGLTLAVHGMTEARQQQKIAETRSSELRRMVEFQQSMLGDLQPRELGQSFVERLRNQHAQSFSHDADEETIAAGIEAFDLAVGRINPTDLAQDLLDEFMMQRAIDNIEADFADQPGLQAALYESVRDIYVDAGMIEHSLPLAQRVVDLRLAAQGPDATATLLARQHLYRLHVRLAEYDDAQAQLDEIVPRLRPNDPEQLNSRHLILDSMTNQLSNIGEHDKAVIMARDNIKLAEQELGHHHEFTVRAINTLGYVLAVSGQIKEGLVHFQASAERARGHFEPHEDAYYSALLNTGAALGQLGRLEEAYEIEREIYENLAGHYGRRHPPTLKVMNNMALTLMDLKRFDEATATMQDILRYTRDAWGPHSPITLSSIQNLASLYLRTDQPDRALQEIETVITWRERLLGEHHSDVTSARFLAAKAALAAEQSDRALSVLTPVLNHQLETLEPDNARLLQTLRLTADIHKQLGDTTSERDLRRQAANPFIDSGEQPGPADISSALRLLELYQDDERAGPAETLVRAIERWLDAGGDELDELRQRYRQMVENRLAQQ